MWYTGAVVLIIITIVSSTHCQYKTCDSNSEIWWKNNRGKFHFQCLVNNNNNFNQAKIIHTKYRNEKIIINTQDKQSTRVSSLACNFLAVLLIISVILALFEVCRDRYLRKQDRAASAMATPELRRCSIADLTVSRHARRVSDHPARLTRDHRSLSAVQYRSLLGAKPPPLIRRSSFPAAPLPRDSSSPGGAGSPAQESNEGTPSHRVRLIRRH